MQLHHYDQRRISAFLVVTSCLLVLLGIHDCHGLSLHKTSQQHRHSSSRRKALKWIASSSSSAALSFLALPNLVGALPVDEEKTPGSFDVDSYLKTGGVAQPMGVSGQAGKSRPETGVILREGSEVLRDKRNGEVLAEILVRDNNNNMVPILASYTSPWPLATGTVFDVECRDGATGDGAFLAVSSNTKGKTSASELSDSFIIDNLVTPTGRFSFYGSPTDVKVVKKRDSGSSSDKNYKFLDLSFSTLSQSTQTEIPRRARIVATIPEGTSQAVMLVASTSAVRYKKGYGEDLDKVTASFKAFDAPETKLRVRGKPVRR